GPGCSAGSVDLLRLPQKVLERLPTSRCGFSDHAIRPSLKMTDKDPKLLKLLSTGSLVVSERELTVWLESEYVKGKWPSQRSKLNRRAGRPSRQTEALRNAVLALVNDGEWSAQQPIAVLGRKLRVRGHAGISDETLVRLVNQLHLEMGDRRLLRKVRSR